MDHQTCDYRGCGLAQKVTHTLKTPYIFKQVCKDCYEEEMKSYKHSVIHFENPNDERLD